ncbi:BA14K family protein [Nitratireductor indicus]|uniref:Lectin-like protein BA14k n=1 Tax=Nitratireductor indicus C115 TaxID=1231190 RepID=K2NXZ7_9HYPH|nr:BA14K family protein [Nitratireductor indicus]EKF44070.1 BA14K-like protein [Nitratireductor indicus C115]MDS1135659.1 BA14K family protein [Nitratireductor indicus]SFQ10854.1 BA14K-like protein [Nitratireductor indicus]
MFSFVRLVLFLFFSLSAAEAAQAGCLVRPGPWGSPDPWYRDRPIDCLFQGRMRVTLGLVGRDRRWPGRRWPLWDPFLDDPWFRARGASSYFHGRDYLFGALRPRTQTRYVLVPVYREAETRMVPSQSQWASHLDWCGKRYRSYRARDNTFQPLKGARRRCSSPFGR